MKESKPCLSARRDTGLPARLNKEKRRGMPIAFDDARWLSIILFRSTCSARDRDDAA